MDRPLPAVVDSRRQLLAAVGAAYAVALLAALGAGFLLRGRHPILVAAVADAVATAVIFLASVQYDNSSLYDPYWSVAPVPIAAYWASVPGDGDGGSPIRKALALVLLCAWAVRLTANCLSRWRSLAHEDFRYVELRGKAGRAYWPLSFLGIHFFPTVWVFLGLLPLYPVLAASGRPVGPLDLVAATVTATAIALEALADLQLHRFLRTRRDPAAVLDSGLWAVTRHPNYLGEVLFWWGLWLFGVAADPAFAWTVIGPLAITLLFLFVSVPWMDRRMLSGHPAWAGRMRTTHALLPWPRRRNG
jgi:steroid 5-alpha reductase family enzyme